MSIDLPERCLRERTDCQPLSQIGADDHTSFISAGLNDGTNRVESADKFRLCWVNDVSDDMYDMDIHDMSDTAAVITSAVSINHHMERETDG